MKQTKLGKQKNRRLISSVFFGANILLSSMAIIFSYCFGCTVPSSRTYAALMSLDAKTKQQKETDFSHGSLLQTEDLSDKEEYETYLDLQRRTKFDYQYYNSYLVLSQNNHFIDFAVSFGAEKAVGTSKLLQVASYYDFNYMESIGIPLFSVSENASKITAKNGAQLGSYISASQAEIIVSENGMLERNEFDLAAAFSELLSDESFLFSIQSDALGEAGTFFCSVNNIYLDSAHSFLLNSTQKKVQDFRYGNYSRSFDYWFENAVFSFSTPLFSGKTSFVFDIRKNYGNFDRFFSKVVPYDYAKRGLEISFFNEDGTRREESDVLNRVSKTYSTPPNYLFLSFAIIFFGACGLLCELSYSHLSKRGRFFFPLCSLGVFIGVQIVFHFLLGFWGNRCALYTYFNPTGNIIFLISFLVVLANAFIWSMYAKKKLQ